MHPLVGPCALGGGEGLQGRPAPAHRQATRRRPAFPPRLLTPECCFPRRSSARVCSQTAYGRDPVAGNGHIERRRKDVMLVRSDLYLFGGQHQRCAPSMEPHSRAPHFFAGPVSAPSSLPLRIASRWGTKAPSWDNRGLPSSCPLAAEARPHLQLTAPWAGRSGENEDSDLRFIIVAFRIDAIDALRYAWRKKCDHTVHSP